MKNLTIKQLDYSKCKPVYNIKIVNNNKTKQKASKDIANKRASRLCNGIYNSLEFYLD